MESEIDERNVFDYEFLKKIVFECLNQSYEKKIRNIINYIERKYDLDLDRKEKNRLNGQLRMILIELQAKEIVVRGEKGYILLKYK